MPLHLNVSTVWKAPTVWINNQGTWKKCAVWLNVSGVWKQITSLVTVALADQSVWDFSIAPNSAHAYYRINSNGNAERGQSNYLGQVIYSVDETWLDAGSASDVQVYCTYSGSAPSGSPTSTWLDCTSSTYWGISTSGGGFENKQTTLSLTFRHKTSQATLDTATISLTAETEI